MGISVKSVPFTIFAVHPQYVVSVTSCVLALALSRHAAHSFSARRSGAANTAVERNARMHLPPRGVHPDPRPASLPTNKLEKQTTKAKQETTDSKSK